jgi:flagellar protein FliT
LTGEAAIMQRYEQALELTRRMLDAAQRSDWDRLVAAERERSVVVNELRLIDRDSGGDSAMRNAKRSLLQEIMALDEQVETLTRDWMRELREVLASVSAEQRLSRTYGS